MELDLADFVCFLRVDWDCCFGWGVKVSLALKKTLPQWIIKTRAIPLGIQLVIGDYNEIELDDSFFGCILQYPGKYGAVIDFSDFVKEVKSHEIGIVVAADLLSLSMLTPPGEWGADVVVGTTQRFGIPMGYGGPHAAYFATFDKYKRILAET